ncbi:hypothetical protein [Hyalangium sp.]|uniref:hypothetical protein n=1 Tax=Hyalangium sp. TaxID=2028555 RepID=UPI002D54682D|nr:hypothetical protein [Hyalangium sp.]HYH98196.1 hypothetical protein [Hyalangium sp.]
MDPTSTGMDLKQPRKRALRILLWIGGILLVLILAGLFAADRWILGTYEPSLVELRKAITENIDFFCEQQSVLAADAWFHEPRTEGDAGPLLNHWLAWESGQEMPKDSPLVIPSQLPPRGVDLEKWRESDVDVSTLDFAWMERLHTYDRWDIMQNTPLEPKAPYNWAGDVLPDFVTLRAWASFRLLHGLKTGQPLPAARDVRQLAWLMYRTESLIGALLGAAVLQLEREAYDAMEGPPPEWKPMRREQIARLKALWMSAPVFSSVLAPVELAKKARSCDGAGVSRCIALAESAFLAKYFEPVARDGYREWYAVFQEELATRTCATSTAKTIWELGVTIKDPEQGLGPPEHPEWAQRLPAGYMGAHIAGMGLAGIVPNFMKDLHELRKAPAEAP